ncbi:hypothetical protein [Psychromonas ossibalaenae]|uniref:hypothetical protein n=1 Tax=Psychromonas ossibalaenae TaxID=444922 RepID=UPI00037E9443|nr:hypothetical protein [Psychromonas ossibalaenae]
MEHGEHSIVVNGNIIVLKFTGAFNEYGVFKFTQDVKNVIEGFNGNIFSILVNNLELLGGTPEAYEEFEKYNKWLNNQNMAAKAIVIKSSATLGIINSLVPSIKSQNIKDFNNKSEAIKWLKEQLKSDYACFNSTCGE